MCDCAVELSSSQQRYTATLSCSTFKTKTSKRQLKTFLFQQADRQKEHMPALLKPAFLQLTILCCCCFFAFSALTLLVGRQEGHPACKKTEWWGVGVVICLDRGADLHTAQLMPLLLTISCFSKLQMGFTFLVPAHPGNPGQRTVKRVCVCVCVSCVVFTIFNF